MSENGDLTRVAEDSARGGFFLFSGAALSTVIMAVAAILIGRLLGPETYGQYSLILVVPAFLFLFTDLGVNSGIVKYAASLRSQGKGERVGSIIRNGLLFRLGMGVALTVACVVFAGYFALLVNRPDLDFWVQFVAVSVALQVVFTTANSAFVGVDRSELNALITNVQALARTGLQIALVLLGFGLGGALIGYLGSYLVSAVLAAFLLFRFFRPKHASNVAVAVKSGENYRSVLGLLARYGMPLYVAGVLVGFFSLYQQMVLSFFVSDAIVGNFRAAFNFIALLTIIPSSIALALLPAFSKLESASQNDLNRFTSVSKKYISLVMMPSTVLVILFAEPIIYLIYGSGYGFAPLFLQLNAVIFYFVEIGYLWLPSLFNGVGKTRLTMYGTLINFVILLFLAPLLAPFYGVVGVIVAYIAGALAGSIYCVYMAKQQLTVTLEFKSTVRILLISGFSAIPSGIILILFSSLNAVVLLVAGGLSYLLAYVTLMPLLGAISASELGTLCKITAKIPLCNVLAEMLRKYQTRILVFAQRKLL